MQYFSLIMVFLFPGISSFLNAQEIYTDYTRIDQYVLNTPSFVEDDLHSLAAYLVEPAENEKEKIRALYRWVTENINYDVQIYLTRSQKRRSPQQVLNDRMTVCDGYAGLMCELGRLAGIQVIQIIGYSKGYGYDLGDHFTDGPNHAWNAVKAEGKWYLLDATWGAGYMDDNNKFIRHFQEHYFLTPPESFLLDHLPEMDRWQLVDRPISLSDFENYLYLKPAFFKYGLSVKTHYQNTIRIYDETQIGFYAPDNVSLVAQLYQNENPLPEYLTFSQRKSSQILIDVQIPSSGEYILRYFAKEHGNSIKYEWAGDYKIIASAGKGKFAGFPFAYSTFSEHNAYLYEPNMHFLQNEKEQKFKIYVPSAKSVAVKVNDEWFPLKGQTFLYEGYITIKPGKIQVLAKFNNGNQYNALLDYICQ